MATFPRRRFNLPTSARRASAVRQNSIAITEPSLGLNLSQPASQLQPGQTPDSENFVVEDGFLTPRSGLSLFSPSDVTLNGDVPVLAIEYQSVDGSFTPIVASGRTVLAFGADGTASWSTLSYALRFAGAPDDRLSGTTLDPISATVIYNAAEDENWLVFTNGVNTPKEATPSERRYSDISDFISVESKAKYAYALDDRLCFFHCADSETTFATRVRWSERGNASRFSTTGAGFVDLMDMRGEGTGAVSRDYDALLFSTDEIWVQQPRRDSFAFDFVPLKRGIGTRYSKTIAKTPIGVIFMGNDFMHYLVRGTEPIPIGHNIHADIRDTIADADYAFSVYNSRFRRYEFYYKTAADAERPGRAVFYDIDNGSWMFQRLPFEVSAGAETADSLLGNVWEIDQISDPVDTVATQINNAVTAGAKGENRHVLLMSSDGTSYRFVDNHPDDNSSTITAQWESHAMSGTDASRKASMREVWTEYQHTDTGAYVIGVRGSPTGVYNSASTITYAAESEGNKIKSNVFITGDHPQFRITVNDGKRPKFSGFVATLIDAGQF